MSVAVEAFRDQNPDSASTLTAEQMEPYAEHHAGGLYVLGAYAFDGATFVKMHDSWGPGTPDEPGTIVVHEYDPDADPDDEDDQTVTYFTDASAAYAYFVSRVDGPPAEPLVCSECGEGNYQPNGPTSALADCDRCGHQIHQRDILNAADAGRLVWGWPVAFVSADA